MKHPEKMAQDIMNNYLICFNSFKKQSKSKSFNVEVDVNLLDLPSNYNPEKLEFIYESISNSKKIDVIFNFKYSNKDEISAEFNQDIFLEINVTINKDEKDSKKERVYYALIHELIHLVQLLIGYNVALKKPSSEEDVKYMGHPGKYTPAEEAISKYDITDPKEIEIIEYILDPEEFYPLLSGSKGRAEKKYGIINKDNFEDFTGVKGEGKDKLFFYLKKYSPESWKKAVSEFWKQIQDDL